MSSGTTVPGEKLSQSQIEDLRLAASKLSGAKRRNFQAEMSLKYCEGKARRAERLFGWNRKSVEVGLAEHRTKAMSRKESTHYKGRIKISHLGRRGLRSKRASMGFISVLLSEMPL
jgi:hypothetical protein